MRTTMTFAYLQNGSEVMLGYRKKDTGLGAGSWAGISGVYHNPIHSDERAAYSGLLARLGITSLQLEQFGIIDFKHEDIEGLTQVHLFKSHKFIGELRENNEIKPQWFGINEVPYHKTWLEENYWISYLFEGRCFVGGFVYDKNNELKECHLDVVPDVYFNRPVWFNEFLGADAYCRTSQKFMVF